MFVVSQRDSSVTADGLNNFYANHQLAQPHYTASHTSLPYHITIIMPPLILTVVVVLAQPRGWWYRQAVVSPRCKMSVDFCFEGRWD